MKGNESDKVKEQIGKLLDRLDDRISEIVLAFYALKTLRSAITPKKIGKKNAEENADVLNQLKYFFAITRLALIYFVIINLCKFFDKDKRVISFHTLIREIEKYKFIDNNELQKIKDLINNDKSVKEIKHIRDNLFAHENIIEVIKKQSKLKLPPLEMIESSINNVQEIFNKFVAKLNEQKPSWKDLKNKTEDNTKFLIKNLKIAKKVRIEKIMEKLKTKKEA